MSRTDNCAKETKQRLLVVVVSLEKKNSQIAQNSQVWYQSNPWVRLTLRVRSHVLKYKKKNV